MLDTKMSTVVVRFTQQCNNAYIDCCILQQCTRYSIVAVYC